MGKTFPNDENEYREQQNQMCYLDLADFINSHFTI